MKEHAARGRVAEISRYATIFKALSDETRLRIYLLLGQGELCVCHIQAALGTTQTKVSRNLGILRNAGLVTSRRDGLWMYYRRSDPGPPALRAFTRELARILESDPCLGAAAAGDRQRACKEGDDIHGTEPSH
jgi:ArsR family transcriptional regulator